ncbi:hypothetical protein NPIL_234031 [Nephila pilipes]|uniref:Uncharacterized protein n=1 Tax=Nephila pilipes TaxID=299642 RepID=A0A8X6U771_NEPPI|nr:hypothetical protein NPIL_234031 [Nephila pilipes]
MLLCGSTLLRPLRLGHLTGIQILFQNCNTFSEHVVRCIHSTILDASLQQHSNNMVPLTYLTHEVQQLLLHNFTEVCIIRLAFPARCFLRSSDS